jgi:hypothetical protein
MVVIEVKKTRRSLELWMIHPILEVFMLATVFHHTQEDEVMSIVVIEEVLEIEVFEEIGEDRTIKLDKFKTINLQLINNMPLISKMELATHVMSQVILVEIVVTERKKLNLKEKLLKAIHLLSDMRPCHLHV